jgi:hypothetical protein
MRSKLVLTLENELHSAILSLFDDDEWDVDDFSDDDFNDYQDGLYALLIYYSLNAYYMGLTGNKTSFTVDDAGSFIKSFATQSYFPVIEMAASRVIETNRKLYNEGMDFLNRAELIAITQTHNSFNNGEWDKNEIAISNMTSDERAYVTKTWNTMNDDRVREAHEELEGVTVKYDEPFTNDYGTIMYPGDPMADIENIVNCRCYLTVSSLEGFQ